MTFSSTPLIPSTDLFVGVLRVSCEGKEQKFAELSVGAFDHIYYTCWLLLRSARKSSGGLAGKLRSSLAAALQRASREHTESGSGSRAGLPWARARKSNLVINPKHGEILNFRRKNAE